jgi:hypothetical protein
MMILCIQCIPVCGPKPKPKPIPGPGPVTEAATVTLLYLKETLLTVAYVFYCFGKIF